MAMDYVINLELFDMDTEGRVIKVPDMALIDEAFRGMTTAQVFEILLKENDEPTQPPTNEGSKPCEDGEDGDPVDAPQLPKGGDTLGKTTRPDDYSDKIKERMKSSIDSHDWASDAKDMSPEKLEELDRKLDDAIRQACEAVGDGAGNFNRKIRELLEVKTPWQEVLADFIHATASGDDISSYRRFNRRTQAAGVYLPTHISESAGEIVIGIDTSGSVGQTAIDQFLSEVKVIVEDVLPEKVHLLYWDSNVASHEVYDEDDYEDLTETTKPQGGGGTNPMCCVEYVKDNISMESEVECMLLLTDAYVGHLDEEDWNHMDYPVLWAVCPDGNKRFNPSVGQVINLD
jgi:predicted metal-dependent peptidase